MRKFLTICAILLSVGASAQWQQTGSRVRYVNGIGIPTRDTSAMTPADSSQILIRPADSSLYVRYKRAWQKVGAGGGTVTGSGTINRVPKWTSSTALGNSSIVDSASAVAMTINPSGNIGINFTSPTYRLDLRNDVPASISLEPIAFGLYNNNDGGSAIYFRNSVSGQSKIAFGVESTGAGTNDTYLGFSTGVDGTLNDRLRIIANGNVGIGTTSPSEKLHLVGNTFRQNDVSNSFGYTISTTSATTTLNTIFGGSSFGIRTGGSGSDNLRITSGGNALIGTTTDNGVDKLQVSGSASVTSLFGVGTSPSAGTVHIKTTSPSIAIDDNDNAGTAAIRFRPQSASFATRGSIELISTGSAAPTRFVIASTDTMTFRTNSVERVRVTPGTGSVLISKTTDNGIDKLQVNGSIDAKGFAQAYTAKGATYTATTSDYLIDCTTGTFTVNLPDALLNVGRILIIKNSGTGTITVDGDGTQTIDGATTYSLSARWATVQIMCDGNNWKIIAKF